MATNPTADEAAIRAYQRRKSRSMALIMRMLRTYLRPYMGLLILGVLVNVIVAATTGALPFFIQQAVDSVFGARDERMLVLIPLGIIVISVVKGVASYASNVIMGFVGQRTTSNIQADLYRCVVRGDLAFINRTHSGEYISLFMNDVTKLAQIINQTIVNLARHLLSVVALTVYMFTMNWDLAMIYVLIVAPLGLVFIRRLSRVTRKASQRGLEQTGDLSTIIAETLGGLRVIKAYGQEGRQVARAREKIENVLRHTMRAVSARAAASPVIEALAGVAVGAIIYYGGRQSLEGGLTAGAFMGLSPRF